MPPKQIKRDRLKGNIQQVNPEEEYVQEELPELNLSPLDTSTNEFDNDYTTLLKIAVENQVPSRYIYIDKDTQEISSVYSILANNQKNNDPDSALLSEVYDEYVDDFQIESIEWVFIFIQQYGDYIQEDRLLEEMNKFLDSQELPTFKNVDYMNSDYFRYLKGYRREIIKEHELVSTIVNSQAFMDTLEPLDNSPLIINSERYEYKIKLPKNLLIEFRMAELSEFIPWIISTYDPYSTPSMRPIIGNKDSFLSKVSPNVSNGAWKLFPKNIDELFQNHWYFPLWIEKENPSSSSVKETRESYTLLELDLNKMILKLEVPIAKELDQETLIQRIRMTFSNIEFISSEKKKINGEFNIYGVELYEYSLSDMILNDDLMSIYLFIDEIITSVATKKRFTIHFKSAQPQEEGSQDSEEGISRSSVNATLNQTFLVEGQPVPIENANKTVTMRTDLKSGTPLVSITVTRARDLTTVELFIKILKRLFRYYLLNRTKTENQFKKYLDISTNSSLQQRKSQRIEKPISQQSKNQLLKKQAPDVIVNNYARLCQSKIQPSIIQPSEVSQYKHVLQFPKPPETKYLFVCDDPKYPFPTIIPNQNLENKEDFPYLPCCTNKDPYKEKDLLFYKIYVENKSVEEVLMGGTKSKHTLRTNKIMGFRRNGTLPKVVTDILSKETDLIFRYGMVYSPSSFLHCLLFATQDPGYMQLTSDEKREEYTQKFRRTISIYPELLAQEMYDIPNKDRMESLRNPYKFLDPSLFYRALEELFGVNIYVFTGYGEEISMSLPRGKYFSARHKTPNTQCVVIYQHEKEDSVDWSQCELIVSTDMTKNKNAIQVRFEPSVNDRLFDIYLSLFQTKTWTMNTKNELVETINAHTLYYGLSISEEIHSHQLLDSYGKLRGLVFKKPKGTMLCPPMAPLNLPEWDKSHDDLPLFNSKKDVLDIVGQDPSYTIVGELIYYLDEKKQIPVRFLVNENSKNKEIDLPYVKYIMDGDKNEANLIHQRDVVGYLLQAVNILYLITSTPLNATKIKPFIEEWIKVGSKNHSYNISGITNPVLPLLKTEEDFFRYWNKICPDMIDIDSYKIIVPSKIFKERLVDHLQRFTGIYEGDEVIIPNVLVGATIELPSTSQDILLTSKTFNIYYNNKYLPEKPVIFTKLVEAYHSLKDPYYFLTEDGRTIMVQNTTNLSNALMNAYEWYEEYRNSKLDLKKDEDELNPLSLPYILYSISPKGTLQIIEDNTDNNQEYLHILKYNDESTYAGLLVL